MVLSLLYVRFFGYIYLGDGGTDRREVLHGGSLHMSRSPGCVFSPFGGDARRGSPKSEMCPPPYGVTHLCTMFSTDNSFYASANYTVRQKIAPFYFCNNFVKPHCILIIFGIQILK